MFLNYFLVLVDYRLLILQFLVIKPERVSRQQSTSTPLIIAVTVGAVLLIVVIVAAAYIVSKRRRNSAKNAMRERVAYNKETSETRVFENDLYSSTTMLT